MKPGGSCNAKPWVASSCPQPNLITRQGCSQRLKSLCLKPDQLFHMTVFRLVSLGQSALADPRHCWAFAWAASSGPCHSILLTWCPLGASVPSPGLQRGLVSETHCANQTCLIACSPGSMGCLMLDCSDCLKQLPELFSLCIQIAHESHKKSVPLQHPSLLSSPRSTSCMGRWQSFCILSLPLSIWSCLHAMSQQILCFHNFQFCLTGHPNFYPPDNPRLSPSLLR